MNALYEKLTAAVANDNVLEQLALQAGIKFNGGGTTENIKTFDLMQGHINHTLFFFNLAPISAGGGNSALAPYLSNAIKEKWGSIEDFIIAFNAQGAALQGSGWIWLVKDNLGKLSITTTPV